MNNAVEALLKERDKMLLEKEATMARYTSEIVELESAIEKLSGKKVWEFSAGIRYDDEHPDYIKMSVED